MSTAPAMRILHCPTTVGGNPPGLARAERALGLDSRAIALQQNRLGYVADEFLAPERLGPLGRAGGVLAAEWSRWRLLRRALRDFDVIHFNFGSSIMPEPVYAHVGEHPPAHVRLYNLYALALELRDLPLLKRAGKGIVVTFQGDDARQGDYARAHFPISIAGEVASSYYTPASDRHKRERIARWAQHADRIFALNPDLLHVLPPQARFMPYAHLDLADWRPIRAFNLERPVVVHAPTHRAVKGTRHIVEAVERLQGEGVEFEFRLVEGLSHAEARRQYEQSDLLVDQLLAGWYGGLAVELMALGRPVLTYLREADFTFLPPDMATDIPIINATPDSLYEVLKLWLTTRRHELPELGRRSRAYVERWHDPLAIAGMLKAEYEAIAAGRARQEAEAPCAG